MRSYVFLAVAVCLLMVCDSADRRRPHPSPSSDCPCCDGGEPIPSPGQFDYYILALSDGTIHGLWPNNCNTCPKDYPEGCSKEKFDISLLSPDLLEEMAHVWPSDRGPNEVFWEHEWACHGTCSGLDQGTYFQTVVDLFEKYRPTEWLCFTNDTVPQPGPCHTLCPYDPSPWAHQVTLDAKMHRGMPEIALPSAIDAIQANKGCPSRSGLCYGRCSD